MVKGNHGKSIAAQIEEEIEKNTIEGLSKKGREEQARILYCKRVAELNIITELIESNILALQLQRQVLRGDLQDMDKFNDVIKEVGEKNLAYGVHFVDPIEVKREIKKFKEDHVEGREMLSEVQEKIDELREKIKEIEKRKKAIGIILQSTNRIIIKQD